MSFGMVSKSFNSFTPHGDGNQVHTRPSSSWFNNGFNSFTPHGDGNIWVFINPFSSLVVLIPLPLTGMETIASAEFFGIPTVVLIPLPLTGMETPVSSVPPLLKLVF